MGYIVLGILLVDVLPVLLAALFLVFLVQFVWHVLKIPQPQALPLRSFDGNSNLYSWEDWQKDARANYPVRYFVTETVPGFFKERYWGVRNVLWRWNELHVRKTHLLDIRGPGYDYGPLAGGDEVMYAAFAALVKWMRTDGAFALEAYDPDQPFLYPEVEPLLKLYWWWLDTRPRALEKISKLPAGQRHRATEALYTEEQAMFSLLVASRSAMF